MKWQLQYARAAKNIIRKTAYAATQIKIYSILFLVGSVQKASQPPSGLFERVNYKSLGLMIILQNFADEIRESL